MLRWLLPLALALYARAQDGNAIIEGQVLSDASGEPLRRARVTLRPAEAGVPTIAVDADDKGNFSIRRIRPGRYSLLASRDGYLTTALCRRGALRMPSIFHISSGQRITNLTFRLRPWAVIAGKVKYEDAAPAVGVRVDVYRQTRRRGRISYTVAASDRTNDRGEYRIHGLPPGAYYVAAVSERETPEPGVEDQPRHDARGNEVPAVGYATTFFPNTFKLSEAVTLRLETGQELGGIDIFLRPTRKVKIRGQITSGVSGSAIVNVTITLERVDANEAGALPAPARMYVDGSNNTFELREVTPGSYLMMVGGADQGKRLSGRVPLTVSDHDIKELEVVISEARQWQGRIVVEDSRARFRPEKLRVRLEPRNEKGAEVNADVKRDGSFTVTVVYDETYDVYVENRPGDYYVKSIRVSNREAAGTGVQGREAAPNVAFDIVLGANGGRVDGRVFDEDGNVMSGASVLLIPDPPTGRLPAYRDGFADEYGVFQLSGVSPGKYVLIAWLDDPPCEPYDPGALDACKTAGAAITVEEGSQYWVPFTVKNANRRE